LVQVQQGEREQLQITSVAAFLFNPYCKNMKDILDGSKQLLSDSIDLIEDVKNEVIIVGGWGPYLRHTDRHPGTKDVDILFPSNYSKEKMTDMLHRFLENGFFLSAKNDFQLCKAYTLGQQTYIYNVDLLHATEGKLNKVDFVKLMDLDVTVDGITVKSVMTINIQHGDVIYSKNLFEEIEFNNKSFRVLDATGIIISKTESCHNKKRPRDIYDIYLSLSEPNTLKNINQLAKKNFSIEEEIDSYAKKIKSDWKTYERHLKEFGVDDPEARQTLLMGR
jgi:hypothetical protein